MPSRPCRARLGLFTPHDHFSPSHTDKEPNTALPQARESPTGHSPPEPCAALSFCMQPVSLLGLRYLVPILEESHLLLSFILPFTQPHLGLRYSVPDLEESPLLLPFILPFTQLPLGLRYSVPNLEESHLLLSFILSFTKEISQRALLCIRLSCSLPNT